MNTEVRKALDCWFDEFRQALKEPKSWDGGHTVIALPPRMIARIFTEKRTELLEIIKQRRVRSISELAQLAQRRVESVSRDLKILHTWGFIRYKGHGRCKEPVAVTKYVVIEVGKTQPMMKKPQRVSVPRKHTIKIYSPPRYSAQRVAFRVRREMRGYVAKKKIR